MKANIVGSAVTGFFFGLTGYFVLNFLDMDQPFPLAVFSGVLFALLVFPVLVVHGKMLDKRFAEFEKEITSPIFYKANGNFNLGNGKVKNGNIYFCEAGIVCASLEKKPYSAEEILVQEIEGFQFDNIHLNIIAKDGRVFVITTPDAPKIIETLRQKGRI